MRAALARALALRDAAFLRLAGTEQRQFLCYYVALQRDVLRRRRTASLPLGASASAGVSGSTSGT